jgi:hypothetical protein
MGDFANKTAPDFDRSMPRRCKAVLEANGAPTKYWYPFIVQEKNRCIDLFWCSIASVLLIVDKKFPDFCRTEN